MLVLCLCMYELWMSGGRGGITWRGLCMSNCYKVLIRWSSAGSCAWAEAPIPGCVAVAVEGPRRKGGGGGWRPVETARMGPELGGSSHMVQGTNTVYRRYSIMVSPVAPAAGGGCSMPGAVWLVAARCGLYSSFSL